VNSDFMRQTVRRIYEIEAQVSYHGVDTGQFRPLALEKQRMILSVGSLTPLKSFDFIIQAIAHIPAGQRPPLAIASNFQVPQERFYLEQLARDSHVELMLLDEVTDEQLIQLYNQAWITAYSPVREPFGLVPLESMACGTPVVAVREGGVPESVVDGETGLLVERDPVQFAEAVRQLLDNPALAADYGRRGREHVLRHWTWEHAVETLERHLTACADTRSIQV
jgi:glycosyltransferase involved in cell wall biosynthesis